VSFFPKNFPSTYLVSSFEYILSTYFYMASPSDLFLTSTNYFSWKYYIKDALQSRGLYQITLGKQNSPTNVANKSKWDNTNDEAHKLIKISISSDLQSHL
jgi:hypothetical protein